MVKFNISDPMQARAFLAEAISYGILVKGLHPAMTTDEWIALATMVRNYIRETVENGKVVHMPKKRVLNTVS